MRVALDTNILAYAEGLGDERRVNLTRRILAKIPQERIVLPAQTLGELYRVLVGKANREAAATRTAVLEWSDAFEVADSTAPCFIAALDLAVDHQLQFWDSLILAITARALPRAAQRGPAARLYLGWGDGGQSLLTGTPSSAGTTPGR